MTGAVKPRILTIFLISGALMFAQTVKDDLKKAGAETKAAGKSVGSAAKKGAKTTKKKVKSTTHKAASKVEEKTRDK